ncbi:hypothetical protein OIU79_008895 [Salix purpurea]|uniref:Uncharacterized protein n=1 Tax=Salix purpurea TaxID=77065 RepID=A0A9Q0TJF8_SALPP|nr:hypothetical protein OIU79_008895 [Salix purpurea]
MQYQQNLHLFCMSTQVESTTMLVSLVFYSDHKGCTQNHLPILYSLYYPSMKTTAQPANHRAQHNLTKTNPIFKSLN